jgi:hypothetical protein
MPEITAVETLHEQRVRELIKRCEQDLRSAGTDLDEGARDRVSGRCAALVTDARELAKAARQLSGTRGS